MSKQLTLASIATAVMAFAPLAAHAYDGTVTFSGALTGASCEIKVNGANNNGTVQLPTVGAGQLAAKGKTSGATNFKIQLSKCQNAGQTVRAFFEAGPNVDNTDGTLINRAASNAAKNVAVQLLDTQGNPLKAGDDGQRAVAPVALKDGAADLIYSAQYIAQDKTEAGSVSTSVTYSIDYL
ncbi:TPA: type 1 fimbrial protein [Burkholderia cenocepacia]|uniref:fimbrial protein n=1 Tax=unclassified Burkholderia TaxID=2613784 RepID=UPI00158EBA3E|nr:MULTISPECIES: fimbrial protein [unclassified Burkholderia]HEF5874735.1 type 1 fimbrial protein [Burkholderia cenocepacia]